MRDETGNRGEGAGIEDRVVIEKYTRTPLSTHGSDKHNSSHNSKGME